MEILENKNNLIIEKNSNNYIFYSYSSLIAIYNENTKKLRLTKLWNYSQTTLKQLKNFINNYTCYNYSSKKEFEKLIDNINIIVT